MLTSAAPGKVADDTAQAHSALMTELLHNLTTPSAAEALFNTTRLAVSRASAGEQVPSVSSSLVEDIRLGTSENAGS